MRLSSSIAPRLFSGSLRLPHLGDCTHEGQPERQRALGDQAQGVVHEALEALVAGAGDPHAAGVAVVDEDRRPGRSGGGRRWTVRRCPSGRTWPTGEAPRSARAPRRAASPGARRAGTPRAGRVGQLVPERLGHEVLLGQVERQEVHHPVVGHVFALIGHHLLGHRHHAEGQVHAAAPRCSRTSSM